MRHKIGICFQTNAGRPLFVGGQRPKFVSLCVLQFSRYDFGDRALFNRGVYTSTRWFKGRDSPTKVIRNNSSQTFTFRFVVLVVCVRKVFMSLSGSAPNASSRLRTVTFTPAGNRFDRTTDFLGVRSRATYSMYPKYYDAFMVFTMSAHILRHEGFLQ